MIAKTKRINSLIRRSAMTQNVSVQDIDYTSDRKLDKTQYERMLSLQFINNKENIINTGPAGIGKSYLAQALGYQACHMLHRHNIIYWLDCLTMQENVR